MKFLIQFLIIIAFSFAGELLHFLLPLPIPASIYGIILLFVALELKLIKVKDIRETSGFLIAVMPVMFIPAAVGLIDSWQAIASAWLQYIVVTVVSTFVVMGVSGWITQAVIRRNKKMVVMKGEVKALQTEMSTIEGEMAAMEEKMINEEKEAGR